PAIKLPAALDPDQFGESSSPAAVPWDEIRGTVYQRAPYLDSKVPAALTKTHQERLETDAQVLDLAPQIEEARKNLSQTIVSLNESTRKKEMEEAERKVSANRNPGNVQLDKVGKPVTGSLNMEDEYLREGLLILSDLITSRIG